MLVRKLPVHMTGILVQVYSRNLATYFFGCFVGMSGKSQQAQVYFYRPDPAPNSPSLVEVRLQRTSLLCVDFFAHHITEMQEKLASQIANLGGLELKLRTQAVADAEECSNVTVDPFVTNLEHLRISCPDFRSLLQCPISAVDGVQGTIGTGISVILKLIATDINNDCKMGVLIAELLLLRCSQPLPSPNLCESIEIFGKAFSVSVFYSMLGTNGHILFS